MENNRFWTFLVLALAAAEVSMAASIQQITYTGIVAGAAGFVALGAKHLTEQEAVEKGKNNRMKIGLLLMTPLVEVMILFGAALNRLIPKYMAVAAVGIVLLQGFIREGLVNKLRKSLPPRIGEDNRIAVISVTLLLTHFNSYFLVYGIMLVIGMAAFDTADLLYRGYE